MLRRTLQAAATAGALAAVMTTPALAASHSQLAGRAAVQDRDGNDVGTVTVNTTPSGMTQVVIALTGLPAGDHGIHVHETGDCSAADFTSAGDHLAGDAEHGIGVEGGPHPGDLPNITVADSGAVNVEVFSDLLTPELMFDDDGAALIVHSGADDYMSQPSGDAGERIACGVFEPS